MATTTSVRRSIPAAVIVAAGLVLLAAIGFGVYFSLPRQTSAAAGPTADATAYLKYLELSDVHMEAAENFMNQQVVEVAGKITNRGARTISRIDVTCYFNDVSGHSIYQQRVPVVTAGHFAPGQTRSFRLPFDTLPAGWNQAMPTLVIAQITFES